MGTKMNKYVYVILDITKNGNTIFGNCEFSYEPIYIGKGNYGRWNSHFVKAARGDTRTHIRAKIKQLINAGYRPIVKILHENLTKEQSSEIEIKLINIIGRKITGDGPLYNITVGGEGGDTYNENPNIESIRKKLMGRPVWNKGRTKESDSRLVKLAETIKNKINSGEITVPSRKGVVLSKETKKKLSESHTGIKLLTPRKDAVLYRFTDDRGNSSEFFGMNRVDAFLKQYHPELSRYKLLNKKNVGYKLEII